jgi:hypothetical protein
MASTGHFTGGRDADFQTNVARQSGHSINMAKLMALSIMAYVAAPVLVFFAADRAFDSNWPSVLGFLIDAAGCVLLARMITWASRNL